MGSRAACTIVSKNYLAFARVLARSFLEHHPGARFFVLIVDRVDGAFDPSAEEFTVVEVEELTEVEDLRSLLFRYTQLEANTAVKPFFLQHLFERYQLDDLMYLDPDIQVFQRFETLEPLLESRSIVVVPHLTSPIEDGFKPTELDILRAGTYNLGFIGLRRTDTTARFLRWWQGHLYEDCVVAFEQGLFVDQRWIDLVPGMFQDVEIVTEPGYNVAYWNLHERQVTAGDPPRVNGEPLYFFHYSGIRLDRLEEVSKHQTRFVLSELGDTAGLYRAYRELLLAAGFERCIGWPYAFGVYDDGTPIPDDERSAHRALGERRARFGDPFATAGEDSFRAWHRKHTSPPAPAASGGGRSLLHRGLKGAYQSAPGRLARRTTRRILGPERTLGLWNFGRRLRDRAMRPAASPAAARVALRPGIELTGYLRTETGMGEAGRSLARALRTRGLPLGLHAIDLNVQARSEDDSLGACDDAYQHGTNVVVVNADQVPQVVEHVGREHFEGHYNVGYWLWELSSFPEEWLASFGPFQEIWTPSSYCVDVISAVSPVPVRRVPLPVSVTSTQSHDRAHFGIPAEPFVFLFAFDFLSSFERKNPLAAIRAFKSAFPTGAGVHLVLKSANSDSDAAARELIAREIEGLPTTWIDSTLARDEVDDLFRCCDCYVSLHRSEGYGLTIAEAMFLEKPVIATAHSGNVDFFNVNNGWPVQYRLVTLERDIGPYKAGGVWAEPEVEHAAGQMRHVFEDADERSRRAARAAQDVRETLSFDAIGALIERRYRDIERRLRG